MYKPSIINYRGFWIHVHGESSAVEILDTYGIVAKTNPYNPILSPKDHYKNDWPDEDGIDAYIPASQNVKPVEISISFYCKCFDENGEHATSLMNSQIRSFIDKVSNGYIRIFDEYTGVGFRNVRYLGQDGDADFKSRGTWSRSIFTLKFSVDEPRTKMQLIGSSSKEIVTLYHGKSETASGAQTKDVTISGVSLTTGVEISVAFTNGNSSSTPYLSLNGGASKPIIGLGTFNASPDYFILRYDGTNYNCTGRV